MYSEANTITISMFYPFKNVLTDRFSDFQQAQVKLSWSCASSKDFLKEKSLKVKDSITAKSASFLLFLIDRQSLSVN